MGQINLRLPEELRREAEKYARKHGYKNVQNFAMEAIREKVLEEESLKETLDIMKNKELMASIKRSIDDVKHGRVITWEELQRRWKLKHAKK